MKLKYVLMAAGTVGALVISCKSEKKQHNWNEYIRPASMEYTKKDTADINALVDNFAALYTKKDFQSVSDMLYKVHNDSIVPLSNDEKSAYVQACNHMNIYGCKKKSIILRSDKNNEVKLTIQIVSSGDLDKEIGVTHLSLNPVYKDGKWYLTLLDKDAEGVEDVYAPK